MTRLLAITALCAWTCQASGVVKLWQREREPLAPAEWTAAWIWAPGGAQPDVNATVFARKTFDLARAPERARLFISADSHYRLYVNGGFVNRGPARCSTKRQSYDVLDVAGVLVAGSNTIAVHAYHAGVPNSFHDTGKPGLLVQLEVADGPTIATDASWRVRRAPEWESSTPRIEFKQGFVEVVDFRRSVAGWTERDFDDSRWEQATPVLPDRSSWIPQHPFFEPGAITRPWVALAPRDLPYLTETAVKATKIVRSDEVVEFGRSGGNDPAANLSQDVHVPLETCKIEGTAEYASGGAPLEVVNAARDDSVAVRGIRSSYLVFDLGRLMYGHPVLEVEGPAGTIIDLGYATHLIGGNVVPAYMGMRLADRVTLPGRLLRWEGRERKAIRYIALTLRNTDQPVRLRFVGLTRTEYPFETAGRFRAPTDPDLERLWAAGAETVRAVTTDAYTDNYREQRQYAGTSFYAARSNAAAFGDTRLQRRYLVQVAEHQAANGIMPPFAPVPDDREFPVILEYNLFWIMGLRDYLLFSGDTRTVETLLPAAVRVLDRFAEMENTAGLIADPPYPFWIDHANIDHRGESFALNAIYLIALDNYAEILDWLRRPGKHEVSARAERARTALRTHFWSEKRMLFADARINGALSPRFTEHTNSLALACGLATPEQAKAVARAILSPSEPDFVRSTSLFMYWIADGLLRAGKGREALDVLKARYRHMLDAGLGTLWEEWSLTASQATGGWETSARATAQAEAAFPPYTLMRWVLGVEPVAPGWKQIVVHPPATGVPDASGVVPTPQGPLSVAWTSAPVRRLTITVPATAKVALTTSGVRSKPITVDGRPAVRDANGRVSLGGGTHNVAFE